MIDSGVCIVMNFDTVFLIFVLCLVLISPNSWFFLWFLICGLVQVLFLSHVVKFLFFSSHFPVTPLDWMCSQVHMWTMYCVCGVQWLRLAQSKGSTRSGDSLLENKNRASFPKYHASLKKIRQCTKSQKRRLYQLTLAMLSSVICLHTWFGDAGLGLAPHATV
jgi:hypothetical protein